MSSLDRMTATPTLTDFLRARLDEDEAVAKEATPGEWRAEPSEWAKDWMQSGSVESSSGHSVTSPETYGPDVLYLVRHQPERVLATVAAHRRIVEQVIQSEAQVEAVAAAARLDPAMMGAGVMAEMRQMALERVAGSLAAIYADHPDYREEWAL